MIVYDTKKWLGWIVLVKCSGSVFHLSAPYAVVAGLIALAVKMDNQYEWGLFHSLEPQTLESSPLFYSPYALQIWGTTVGFLLVFRGNLAYARYWDGRGHLARLSSYLQETAMMAVCFDEVNKEMNQYREWKAEILHQISLLHALAIQCLRLDADLGNLVKFNRLEQPGHIVVEGHIVNDSSAGATGAAAGSTLKNPERSMISPSRGMGRRRYSIDADALRHHLQKVENTGLESELGTLREGSGDNPDEEMFEAEQSDDEEDEYVDSQPTQEVAPVLSASSSPGSGTLPPLELPGSVSSASAAAQKSQDQVSQARLETLESVRQHIVNCSNSIEQRTEQRLKELGPCVWVALAEALSLSAARCLGVCAPVPGCPLSPCYSVQPKLLQDFLVAGATKAGQSNTILEQPRNRSSREASSLLDKVRIARPRGVAVGGAQACPLTLFLLRI